METENNTIFFKGSLWEYNDQIEFRQFSNNDIMSGFERWLDHQINSLLFNRFMIIKPLNEITKDHIFKRVKTAIYKDMKTTPQDLSFFDIVKWRDMCCRNYETNGNLGRFMAMNKFLDYIGCDDWKLNLPHSVKKFNPTLNEEERCKYLKAINNYLPPLGRRKIENLTPRQLKGIMERAIVLLQTLTCCRPADIYKAETDNVNFKKHRIYVNESKTHEIIIRCNMEDVLYLPPIVERSIQGWIKIRKTFKAVKEENEKYLFIHPNNFAKGKRISYWAVQRLCKKIGELAGIKEVITIAIPQRTTL